MVNKMSGQYYQPIDTVYQEAITNDWLKNRRIWFNEEVDEISVTKAIYSLNKLKKIDELNEIPVKDRQPITIICNSPGGLCYQGLFLCSIIESMVKEGYSIITVTGGMSASMSFLIGLCGNIRKCYEYSTFLCHQPSGGEIGEAIKIKRTSDELDRLWELSKIIIRKHSNMSDELLNTIYKESWDYIMDSNQALQLKIVDEII
jgi:ATP-dependent Clp protease protease subunit